MRREGRKCCRAAAFGGGFAGGGAVKRWCLWHRISTFPPSKDRASAENPWGFPADLARSFPVHALTFSSASFLWLRQKAEVPEYLQGSDSRGVFGWIENIHGWKFHEGDSSHIDKFPTHTLWLGCSGSKPLLRGNREWQGLPCAMWLLPLVPLWQPRWEIFSEEKSLALALKPDNTLWMP